MISVFNRIFAFYLAVVMLVSSIGVHIMEHFCTETNHKSVSLYMNSGCEEETNSDFTCCSTEDEIPSEESWQCSDCCITNDKFEKSDVPSILTKPTPEQFSIQLPVVYLASIMSGFNLETNIVSLPVSGHSPPLIQLPDVQAVYQIFRC